MSLQEIIESFRTGLMLTGLWVLAAIVAGCIGVWLYRSAQSTTALLRRLRTWIDGIVFTLLFTACVLIGGTKTNSPPMGLMVPLPPSLPQSVVQTVTDEDIARGYREVAETNCEASVYAMPEGITPSFNWHKRGTFGEWARLDLGDFAFPLGTNDGAVTSFSVFNDGRIRPTPRDAAREICAVGVPMLAMQGAIFEDAYEARRGVMMPKRSSRVRITVDAYGGDYGGVLSLASANLGKLTPIGNGVTLPPSRTLAADEYFHTTGVYEGAVESTEENDVSVSGTFTEHFTAQQHLSSNRLTVVKIELKPNVTAPKNNALGRHEYGVCELVRHEQHPSVPVVTWNPVGGGSNTVNDNEFPCYQFPLFACENPLRVELGDATYLPRLSCIEPTGIEVREVSLCTYGLPAGKAGGIGLLQAFYVKPFTVSFTEIAVEEVPSDRGEVDGYFRHALPSNLWSHTSSAGAGIWHDVFPGNRMGDPNFRDEAALAEELLPITPDGTLTNDYSFGWMWGTMTWEVPFGWNVKGTTNGTAQFKAFECTTQEFHIDPWGNASVLKFEKQATRRLDDSRYRNGVRVYNNEVRNP